MNAIVLNAGVYAFMTGFFAYAATQGGSIRWRRSTIIAAIVATTALVGGVMLVPTDTTVGEVLWLMVPTLALAAVGYALERGADRHMLGLHVPDPA